MVHAVPLCSPPRCPSYTNQQSFLIFPIIMLHSALNCCRATSTTGPSREQPRCLGAALAVALHLLAAPGQHASAPESFGSDALPVPQACRPSRVLLVTTGPATKVGQPGIMLPFNLTPKGVVCFSFFCFNQGGTTQHKLANLHFWCASEDEADCQTAIHCLVYTQHYLS